MVITRTTRNRFVRSGHEGSNPSVSAAAGCPCDSLLFYNRNFPAAQQLNVWIVRREEGTYSDTGACFYESNQYSREKYKRNAD